MPNEELKNELQEITSRIVDKEKKARELKEKLEKLKDLANYFQQEKEFGELISNPTTNKILRVISIEDLLIEIEEDMYRKGIELPLSIKEMLILFCNDKIYNFTSSVKRGDFE